MRVERVVLKDQSDAAVFGRKLSHIVVAEKYLSLRRGLKPGDHVKSCALSASGGAEKTYKLAVRHFYREVIDRNDLFVRLFVPAREDLRYILQNDFHCPPYLSFMPLHTGGREIWYSECSVFTPFLYLVDINIRFLRLPPPRVFCGSLSARLCRGISSGSPYPPPCPQAGHV